MKIHTINDRPSALKDFTFRSGDDLGKEITCYGCGAAFLDSFEELQSLGADMDYGDVVTCQNCHGRCAVIESI